MVKESLYKVGRRWLVSFDWVNCTKIKKLWFGGQIERFVSIFGLSKDDVKKLKQEIYEATIS